MQVLGVIFILAILMVAMGPWFWVLVGLGVVGLICHQVFGIEDESLLSDDERETRRRHREEEQHAQRMAQIENEHKQQLIAAESKANRGSLWGTAAKIAVSVGMHALTGGKHKHRH